jgi:hypothetical protein
MPYLWLETNEGQPPAAMLVLHPSLHPSGEIEIAENIIVIDCSSSMTSTWNDSLLVLQQLIDNIELGQFFNIFAFGSNFSSCFLGSLPKDKATSDATINFIKRLFF